VVLIVVTALAVGGSGVLAVVVFLMPWIHVLR